MNSNEGAIVSPLSKVDAGLVLDAEACLWSTLHGEYISSSGSTLVVEGSVVSREQPAAHPILHRALGAVAGNPFMHVLFGRGTRTNIRRHAAGCRVLGSQGSWPGQGNQKHE